MLTLENLQVNFILSFLESDNELEGLIPEVSESDIKILSIEPEPASTPDERQIYGRSDLLIIYIIFITPYYIV